MWLSLQTGFVYTKCVAYVGNLGGNGDEAISLDQKDGSKPRKLCLNVVVGKTNGQYKRFWTSKIFSGKGFSPKIITGGDIKVKEPVAENRFAMGYMSASSVDEAVRVISVFQ